MPLPSAKGLSAHVGGNKVAVSESSGPAQEVGQTVGYTRGRVAPPLLHRGITSNQTKKTPVNPVHEITPDVNIPQQT